MKRIIILLSLLLIGAAPMDGAYRNKQRRAKRRGKSFSLTKKQFVKFEDRPCTYCGQELLGVHLDRVNNRHGYLPNNVVQACPRCNSMKSQDSVTDWFQQMKKILKHSEGGK